jgi:hypothetical protein
MVSEADRIKAVEKVRAAMAPIFGGTPSYKRKRSIYRALKRGQMDVVLQYECELALSSMLRNMVKLFYGEHYK